jgi:hypothetical protein
MILKKYKENYNLIDKLSQIQKVYIDDFFKIIQLNDFNKAYNYLELIKNEYFQIIFYIIFLKK